MSYKWDSPHGWLRDKIQEAIAENKIEYLVGVLNTLMADIDSDTIQEHFQKEMDDDGYFKEVENE